MNRPTGQSDWDVIVLGGGAAGLMCASVAGQRGLRVLVLERNAEVGKKILISGGGRANFTNREVGRENFYSGNEHFVRSALTRYPSDAFIELVDRYGIAYHEKKLGQLFCDESARQIVDMLVAECGLGDVRINCGVEVLSVEGHGPFVVTTSEGVVRTSSLVVATGGLSIPKIGATDFGHRLARQYGLSVTELRPALVPLTFRDEEFRTFKVLAGTSVDCRVEAGGQTFRENVLFTHWGLSGPAILQASTYWEPNEPIALDLLPEVEATDWLLTLKRTEPRLTLVAALKRVFSARFARAFGQMVAPEGEEPLAEMKNRELARIGSQLNRWLLKPAGTSGYKKAEVTRGGVSTDELSSKSMESKGVPGLYFVGEVVDVTGWLGGYNFQWAWASGVAAGSHVPMSV